MLKPHMHFLWGGMSCPSSSFKVLMVHKTSSYRRDPQDKSARLEAMSSYNACSPPDSAWNSASSPSSRTSYSHNKGAEQVLYSILVAKCLTLIGGQHVCFARPLFRVSAGACMPRSSRRNALCRWPRHGVQILRVLRSRGQLSVRLSQVVRLARFTKVILRVFV